MGMGKMWMDEWKSRKEGNERSARANAEMFV